MAEPKRLKQSEVKDYREEMLREQDGKCSFCGEECVKPCLDHAHREPHKDKIRGVLCNWCNIAIGKLENARIRTGTNWKDFRLSFFDVYHYIQSPPTIGPYSQADWHPSKRKTEVREFKKLNAQAQIEYLKRNSKKDTTPTDLKNQAARVKCFRKIVG